jgi:hypothetical protein
MRKYITPSVVISLVALTLSLMGVGYAAISLPRDSVGKTQIKSGAVGSPEVADGSLQPVDFSKAAIAKLTGAAGPKGDTGEAGAKGDAGAAGTGGSGNASGPKVTGADGTVVGTLVDMDATRGNNGSVTVQLSNGLLAEYLRSPDSTWPQNSSVPMVFSLAPDCSEPRYTPLTMSNSFPHGYAYRAFGSNWTFDIGAHAVTVADNTQLYLDYVSGCALWGLANSFQGQFVQVHAVADVPVLTTPVTIG